MCIIIPMKTTERTVWVSWQGRVQVWTVCAAENVGREIRWATRQGYELVRVE